MSNVEAMMMMMIFVSLQFEGTPALKGGLSFDLKKKVKNPKYFYCLGYYIEKKFKKKEFFFSSHHFRV